MRDDSDMVKYSDKGDQTKMEDSQEMKCLWKCSQGRTPPTPTKKNRVCCFQTCL